MGPNRTIVASLVASSVDTAFAGESAREIVVLVDRPGPEGTSFFWADIRDGIAARAASRILESKEPTIVRWEVAPPEDRRARPLLVVAPAWADETTILRNLCRGRFSHVKEHGDASLDREELEELERELVVAKLETWEHGPPDPLFTLGAYATLCAEIAEERWTRGHVLTRHRLDEDSVALEDWAWGSRLAAAGERGDTSLAEDYGVRFEQAQDAIGAEWEDRLGLPDYAKIKADLEIFQDPSAALAHRGLTRAAWARLERRIQRTMREGSASREAVHRAVVDERRTRASSGGAP